MEYDRQEILIQRAEHAEQSARQVHEPAVKETMIALAELYRELARQLQELAELRKRARELYRFPGFAPIYPQNCSTPANARPSLMANRPALTPL